MSRMRRKKRSMQRSMRTMKIKSDLEVVEEEEDDILIRMRMQRRNMVERVEVNIYILIEQFPLQVSYTSYAF